MKPTITEKQEMALLKASGCSHPEIARRTGRSRECVIKALRSKDVEGLKGRARDALLRIGVIDSINTNGPALQIAIGFAPRGCSTSQPFTTLSHTSGLYQLNQ